MLSSTGTEYTGKLLKGDYSLLWISTPSDWHVRIPAVKLNAHWQRINHWIRKAIALGLLLVIFGPPGFLWKMPNIKETLQESNANVVRMRLCHFGDKFDQAHNSPSGSYLQVATTRDLGTKQWQCNCTVPIQKHQLDWYGRSPERTEWRQKISVKYVRVICQTLELRGNVQPETRVHAILDDMTPPLPISEPLCESPCEQTTLPTESRIRRKLYLKKLKEQGLKPSKRHKDIEPGTDDCGEDISGLGKECILLSCDVLCEGVDSSDDDSRLHESIPMTIKDPMGNVESIIAYLCYGKYNEVDLLELCGGDGRISQIAFRRGLTSGGNLDLTTGCDLGNPATQRALNHYLDTCYVLVAILQPNCRSVGKLAYFNAKVNYDTWHKHYEEDLPHMKYCGVVALKQMRMNRYFMREQPAGTQIDEIDPWPDVVADDTVESLHMDQCAAGAIDDDGAYVQKRTKWTSNSQTLLKPMVPLQCDGTHIHGTPCNRALEKLKVYPWKLCHAVVTGVKLLKAELARSIYPTTSTGTATDNTPPVPPVPPEIPHGGLGCGACNANMRRESPQHTRDPHTCKQSRIASKPYECPVCASREARYSHPRVNDPGHTLERDKCRFSDQNPQQRTGAHPRDPRPRANEHPSAQHSSYDASRDDYTYGPGDVPPDVPLAYGEEPPPPSTEARSSGEPPPPSTETRSSRAARRDPPQDSPEQISAGKGKGRGPDLEPREERQTHGEAGAGPARLPDWSRFNIQISLRNLRSYDAGVVQRELRKLHLRWWHAREPKMRTILQAAGVDEVRLNMIRRIVDTCRECRAWQKRGNVVTASISLPSKFNEKGQCDIMFYKRQMAWHIIDECIRLSDGCHIPDKECGTLLNAYATTWVQRHGPFQILSSDGEPGLNNETAIAELKRLGTELRIQAPLQHASIAESRQSMLRHVMHMIEEELKRTQDQTIPFARLYAEALFVVNCFSFYNGVSPYNAHTGRQPAFLPDLENIDYKKGNEASEGNREQRIREAGIEAITQSTAIAKINRALKAKTTIDGSQLYKTGDLIDYHRPTTTKDEHGGWNGPYPIVRNEPERGRLICAHGGREIAVRYPDARLTLLVETLLTNELGLDNDAIDTIIEHVSSLASGKTPETFGYTKTQEGRLQLTTASRNAPKVLYALQYMIRNFFRISDVIAVRLGKGVHNVSRCNHADGSVLFYYTSDVNPVFYCYETKDTALNIQHVTQCSHARIVQCLVKRGCPRTIDDNIELGIPEAPIPDYEERQGNSPASPEIMTPGPPTPRSLDIGGDLPTIHEEDDGAQADELIVESWYAELTSDTPLEPTKEEEHGNVPPCPVHMMPENTVLFTTEASEGQHGNELPDTTDIYMSDEDADPETYNIDEDDIGQYVELCFTGDMAPIVLDEGEARGMTPDDVATIRVYIAQNTKRAVVVKEDDLLSKQELLTHAKEVAKATVNELTIWINNTCFKKCLLKNAQNVMTSRYVAKWKWIKGANEWTRIIRMRLVLRGFMDTEAFSLDTFSGTAKRVSQRILASEVACHPDWISASLDIDKAFLKGFTYRELAEATGEKERTVCFRLPPGSATFLRKFPGFEDFDETTHCLQCVKPGTGTKDAPRAFSLKLRQTTQKIIGLRPTSYDPEFEIKKDLQTAKHVDDVNMGGVEPQIDHYHKEVEKVFGPCKINKRQFTNCAVQSTLTKEHDVILDQDDYIKTLRPIVHSDLTGAAAEKEATKIVTDLFVSLRGAIAYAMLTQAWLQVYIVALQRIQQPTNLDVRRLNAITRKLQKEPQKLIFPAMKCSDAVDLHTDSGYRRIDSAGDVKGYGMRGLCVLRRGVGPKGNVVHLIDSVCKSHRLTIRSSYGAEMLAASHGYEDAFPTLVTLVELKHGVMKPEELKACREHGGLELKVTLTTDAESVYKSLTCRDLKTPAEKTLLGQVMWIRELLQLGLIEALQWCDTRDMTADGHTKGSIDREMLLNLMKGQQVYRHDVKKYTPHRGGREMK